jgi:hypothetical protein
MVLEVEPVRVGRVASHLVDALPELDVGIGQEYRPDALVARPPGCSGVLGPVPTAGRDGDHQRFGVPGVDQDGVQAQATAAGEPLATVRVVPEPLHELEAPPSVAAPEQGRGLDAGVDDVGIIDRAWSKLPDAGDARSCPLRKCDRSLVLLGPGGPGVLRAAEGRAPVEAHRCHEPDGVHGVPPRVEQRGVDALTGEQGAALGEGGASLAREHKEAFRGADQSRGRDAPAILRRSCIDLRSILNRQVA